MARIAFTILLFSFGLIRFPSAAAETRPHKRPNVICILLDDLGYGDFSCYGNSEIQTPHIDRLAAGGLRFTQFYVTAPVCSASRVGYLTGQHPARHRIYAFLASRKENRTRRMVDYLESSAPSVARAFQAAGYATAHIGKWHLGGGRDVGDAPLPSAYGFDESYSSFEGLGDRVLIPDDGLSKQSAALGQGEIDWAPKHRLTEIYVDRTIDFLRRASSKPAYIQLWLNDVHDPFAPTAEQLEPFERFVANPYEQQYYAVLTEVDRQIGRLMAELERLGLDSNTLILLSSDNGPTAWARYTDQGFEAPGSSGGLRGRKWSLYEGGVRSPLIVYWPGVVPAGRVDETSVVSSLDFFPTLCSMAGVQPPNAELDGIVMSGAFRGTPQKRSSPLFWTLGLAAKDAEPALPSDRSPKLAIREGQWKLLANADGSRMELYDLFQSPDESQNVAAERPEVAERLSKQLFAWWESMPRAPVKKAISAGPAHNSRRLARCAFSS